mmetsp:Transcript_14013/g.45728  ORF Transcript_14013/g.45728 Transcript_14013/m.45728 type:complete len:483 (+) Transcript_14013:62-1510(+)
MSRVFFLFCCCLRRCRPCHRRRWALVAGWLAGCRRGRDLRPVGRQLDSERPRAQVGGARSGIGPAGSDADDAGVEGLDRRRGWRRVRLGGDSPGGVSPGAAERREGGLLFRQLEDGEQRDRKAPLDVDGLLDGRGPRVAELGDPRRYARPEAGVLRSCGGAPSRRRGHRRRRFVEGGIVRRRESRGDRERRREAHAAAPADFRPRPRGGAGSRRRGPRRRLAGRRQEPDVALPDADLPASSRAGPGLAAVLLHAVVLRDRLLRLRYELPLPRTAVRRRRHQHHLPARLVVHRGLRGRDRPPRRPAQRKHRRRHFPLRQHESPRQRRPQVERPRGLTAGRSQLPRRPRRRSRHARGNTDRPRRRQRRERHLRRRPALSPPELDPRRDPRTLPPDLLPSRRHGAHGRRRQRRRRLRSQGHQRPRPPRRRQLHRPPHPEREYQPLRHDHRLPRRRPHPRRAEPHRPLPGGLPPPKGRRQQHRGLS